MRSLLAVAAAVVLAGTIGTAVYAMVQDDPDPAPVASPHRAADEESDGGAGVAAICLEGATDCDDTIDSGGNAAGGTCLEGTTDCIDTPDYGFEQCATEEPCGDFAECPADMSCVEPWLMDPPVCPDGVSVEECFPDGVPAGYACLTLESFPVQTKCYPIGCAVDGGPVTILPARADPDAPVDVDPQVDRAPESQAEEPVLPVEPCIPDNCVEDEAGAVICKPIEDPCLPQPDPNVRCLPPDCAVSSDGSVNCPVPLPQPCIDPGVVDPAPGAEPADDLLPRCETPPHPGDCELTPEECARLYPPSQGRGTSEGSPGSTIE
jgi:hypothetical protein